MITREHLIKNAINSLAKGLNFDYWVNWERLQGDLKYDMGEYNPHDLELIWDCADYVVHKIFCGPEDFNERNF